MKTKIDFAEERARLKRRVRLYLEIGDLEFAKYLRGLFLAAALKRHPGHKQEVREALKEAWKEAVDEAEPKYHARLRALL